MAICGYFLSTLPAKYWMVNTWGRTYWAIGNSGNGKWKPEMENENGKNGKWKLSKHDENEC